MARLDINRSGEMEVFVRVVEQGSFSAAARALRMTPSAISKLVGRLEGRLGARLVNRSTRRVQLTPEGCVFYERSVRVLADLDEAERGAATNGAPRGRLCINANVPFGRHFLLPLVPEFLALHPDVTLDIVLTDEVIDILEQRTDVAVRAGPLKSSRLLARKLGETRKMIVAAPSYLERCGVPENPVDLERHNCLGFNYARTIEGWPLIDKGRSISVATMGTVQISDGDALRHLAVAGVGLARLAHFQVRDDIAAGRLQPVLENCNPGDSEEIHAVFLGQGGYLPARVRAFLDFLVERVKFD
ncbi:LysR family transcriptional regulator [Paralcaligenes sp. KSB-10]|jgi:DNA-binding transcriptional LysR family regulator|uniref:LysR family transcriptional regulator n=1 Tax=Paralcaligenes sp. KSB-10 TaxID=2901142 RepID=UPI001E3AF1CC|nr:LysR family transcriptional regulator [Paralcaligenes sp. KSB-10]UHL63017.1 LysR family transcriptional regulator [Paralcaligenes sp. KSB-10]